MNSVDLSKTIAPKSDQLNADDLIAGPITITITQVKGSDEPEQPISVYFEGDGGKPYKPCKSMRRVLVHCWGREGADYPGRRLTLIRDENVMFGGIKVGGIRISHMSHIDRVMEMALTVTKARRAPYKVAPLKAEVREAARRQPPPQDDFPGDRRGFGSAPRQDAGEMTWADRLEADLRNDVFRSAADLNAFTDDEVNRDEFDALSRDDPARARRIEATINGRRKALTDRERGE